LDPSLEVVALVMVAIVLHEGVMFLPLLVPVIAKL
jgi:hypothetical protein